MFGYHDLGYACIEALLGLGAPIAGLFTHRDDPGEEIWWRSCAELAAKHGIPVLRRRGTRAGSGREAQVPEPGDHLLVQLSATAAARHPGMRVDRRVQLHPSKLPAYRGRAPINWVLVNGERETGVTLHHMVARADAGDIVGQETVAIEDRDTALSLTVRLRRWRPG